ncbi:MAG: hypothetical protein ACYDEO_11525, partial [Aggregatilineales bacterium]
GALWELVPTDRQRLYRAIYDRTRRDEGASGSDALEARMIEQLLARYADKALVPVGSYWVPTPQQIQDAAKADLPYANAEMLEVLPKGKRPGPIFILTGLGSVLLFGYLLLHGMSKSATLSSSSTPTPTLTLARTYTPTPLALDAQDAIIQGGSGLGAVYPVNLRINVIWENQPRIFVVQRRVVNTAEWLFDDDPDVASYIVGLTVHPVLGIPWSEANANLFAQVTPGSIFTVQMNTGTTLRFVCTERRQISRADTSVFGQGQPGLTLVLIGQQTSDMTQQTDQRLVLLADYIPGQETTLMGAALPTVPALTPTASPTLAQRVDAQIVSVTTQPGRLTLKLRIFNGQFAPLTLDNTSIYLTYGYSPQPAGPRIAAETGVYSLQPGQAADLTLIFAWHGEPFATLGVLGEYAYAFRVR